MNYIVILEVILFITVSVVMMEFDQHRHGMENHALNC